MPRSAPALAVRRLATWGGGCVGHGLRLLGPAGLLGLALGVGPAGAAAPARLDRVEELKEVWSAPGLAGDVVELRSDAGVHLVGLEPVPGATGRSVVRFDPRDGHVIWRLPPPPGVVWTSLAAGEDGLALTGQHPDDPAATPELALVDLRTGALRWSRLGQPGDSLRVGERGGLVIDRGCDLLVVGPADGATWEVVPGRTQTVDAEDEAGELHRSVLCTARPRLLGAVGRRLVVLAPQLAGSGWRLFAMEGPTHAWDQPFGALDAAPGVDWGTSSFWTFADGWLRLQRWDLSRGSVAWEQMLRVDDCAWAVRGYAVPGEGPGLLVRACEHLSALDPHSGSPRWELSFNADVPLVLGEPLAGRELIQAGGRALTVGWMGSDGRPLGAAVVPAGGAALAVGDDLVVRGASGVTRVHADGSTRWSLPVPCSEWRRLGDLLLVRVAPGATGRGAAELEVGSWLALELSSGAPLGRLRPEELPVTVVPMPDRATTRLLVVTGPKVRALRLGPPIELRLDSP